MMPLSDRCFDAVVSSCDKPSQAPSATSSSSLKVPIAKTAAQQHVVARHISPGAPGALEAHVAELLQRRGSSLVLCGHGAREALSNFAGLSLPISGYLNTGLGSEGRPLCRASVDFQELKNKCFDPTCVSCFCNKTRHGNAPLATAKS